MLAALSSLSTTVWGVGTYSISGTRPASSSADPSACPASPPPALVLGGEVSPAGGAGGAAGAGGAGGAGARSSGDAHETTSAPTEPNNATTQARARRLMAAHDTRRVTPQNCPFPPSWHVLHSG